jgi:hypothetical protein
MRFGASAMSFKDTLNKATVRRTWDLQILQNWSQQSRVLLTYLGLPGEEIHDLLDWRQVLDRKRTGIESPGHNKRERDLADETIGRLNTNVLAHRISSGFELLVGDAEDVIIDGHDVHGKKPQMSDGGAPHLARFSYDLVNLDFDGGLGYRSMRAHGTAKRTIAIKKLFERQEGHSFILLLTINVRHTLGEEIQEYLGNLQTRDRGLGWGETLSWYLNRGKGEEEYKLKAIVPSFVQAAAELRMFRSICRPPIVYDGHEHARMVHFVFELERQPGNLRAFGQQDDRDLIELPLLRCVDGRLQLAADQHPNFNVQQAERHLSFLPTSMVAQILGQATSAFETYDERPYGN